MIYLVPAGILTVLNLSFAAVGPRMAPLFWIADAAVLAAVLYGLWECRRRPLAFAGHSPSSGISTPTMCWRRSPRAVSNSRCSGWSLIRSWSHCWRGRACKRRRRHEGGCAHGPTNRTAPAAASEMQANPAACRRGKPLPASPGRRDTRRGLQALAVAADAHHSELAADRLR